MVSHIDSTSNSFIRFAYKVIRSLSFGKKIGCCSSSRISSISNEKIGHSLENDEKSKEIQSQRDCIDNNNEKITLNFFPIEVISDMLVSDNAGWIHALSIH